MAAFFPPAAKAPGHGAAETATGWPASISSTIIWISVLSVLFYFYRWMIEYPSIGLDFMNVWYAAHMVLSGKAMALFDLVDRHALQMSVFGQEFLSSYLRHLQPHTSNAHELILLDYVWAYPPHFLPWIAGFGLISYFPALILWIALTFTLYAFAVVYKRPQAWWLVLVLFAAPASCENIDMGYTGFLIAAFFVGGLRLLDQRPVLAGILFGFLSFKPQFALLIPLALIAGCHWRALASAALTTMLLVALSILLFGFESWNSYFHVILPYEKEVIEAAAGEEKVKTILMVTPFMAARFLGFPVFAAYGVAGFFFLTAAAMVVYAFMRRGVKELRNAVLLTAVYFATPYAFVTDMPLLSAALVSMVAARGTQPFSSYEQSLLAAGWLLPAFVALFNYVHTPIGPVFIAALLALQLRWLMESYRRPSLGPETMVN